MVKPSDPDLLTARQVAAQLGVTISCVAKWARSGRLPTAWRADGLTGLRLFARADVDRLGSELNAGSAA